MRHGGSAGLRARDRARAAGDRRGGASPPACAGAAAPGFPPASNGARSPASTADQKYIVCNADEGDSGTFADRMLMEGDPFVLIEGMTIAGFAVGATQGLHLHPLGISARLSHASDGDRSGAHRRVCSARFSARAARFDIEARLGAGAYICGEETSLLESLEGRRGQVRAKPPLPAIEGLFGKPTVINNVLSLRLDAVDSRQRRQGLRGIRHGPLARHAAVPARRQCQARRARRARVRRDDPPSSSRISAAARDRAGRSAPCRSAGRSAPISRKPARHAARLRGDARRPRACSATAASSCSTTRVDLARQARFAFEFCAERKLRQMHALPHRLDARRRDGRQDHRRRWIAAAISNCCAISARC